MKSGRILITGAGGFVGRALALGFAELGWEVWALDRSFDDPPGHDGIRYVVADLLDGAWADVPQVDVVVHAAWLTSDPASLGLTEAEYQAKNLAPLTAVLSYATHRPPEALVFVSSSGVFAAGDAEEGLTDVHVPTGSSPYATSKRRGEMLTSTWGSEGLANTHVIRLGYLFGPHEAVRPTRQGVSLVARWMDAARDGRPIEVRADDPTRDWTFTPDLAPARVQMLAESPARRPVHLGSPHVVHDRELASWISDETGGGEVVTVPAGARVKPPMVPSDLSALRHVQWTTPRDGIRALVEAEAVA